MYLERVVYDGYTRFKGLYGITLDHNPTTAPLRSTSDHLDARANNISAPNRFVLNVYHSPLFKS
jgi:hypothetical protein